MSPVTRKFQMFTVYKTVKKSDGMNHWIQKGEMGDVLTITIQAYFLQFPPLEVLYEYVLIPTDDSLNCISLQR